MSRSTPGSQASPFAHVVFRLFFTLTFSLATASSLGQVDLANDEEAVSTDGLPTTAESEDKESDAEDTPGERDDLLGWYEMGKGDRLIPVFRDGSTYYSVCRGFEVPFELCPEGLKWGLSPSSMEGTLIGYEDDKQEYYIAVRDAQAANFTDGRSGAGKPEVLTPIDPPVDPFDGEVAAPETNEDFVGLYMPSWQPFYCFEVYREGDVFRGDLEIWSQPQGEPGEWHSTNEFQVLTPLAGGLGFSIDEGDGTRFVYSKRRRRYEIVSEKKDAVMRMPMARLSYPGEAEDVVESAVAAGKAIGIPTWH